MSEICPCGSQGALSEIAVVSDSGTERYDFVAEDLQLNETIVGDQGITGTLDLFADHHRRGAAFVSGGIMLNVSPLELENWLPRIFRGTKIGDTHFPGEESPEFDIIVKRDKATYRYTDLQVDKALFRASANSEEPGLLEMMLTFIGVDEEPGTWPDPAPERLRDNVLYWLLGDTTLTINSVEYYMEAFNLQIDNMLRPLMRNSLRPVCIRSEGRRFRFQPAVTHCADTVANLYFGDLDAAGRLAFESTKNLDNSDSTTIFDFARLIGPRVTPSTRGRTETFLRLDLSSYPGDDLVTDPSLKVTNTFPA